MAEMAVDNIEEVLEIDGRVKVVPWDLVVRESGVKSSKKGGGSDFGVGRLEILNSFRRILFFNFVANSLAATRTCERNSATTLLI